MPGLTDRSRSLQFSGCSHRSSTYDSFLILELKSDYRPFNRYGDIGLTRDIIWLDWSISLFNGDRDLMYLWDRSGGLSFPKLEKLTLDFTEWRLSEADGLLVSILGRSTTIG